MKLKASVSLISAALLVSSNIVSAEALFSAQKKTEVINNLAKALADKYVLVEEGKQFGLELQELNRSGKYANAKTKHGFFMQLDQDLIRISNDKHMHVLPKEMLGGSGPVVINAPDSKVKVSGEPKKLIKKGAKKLITSGSKSGGSPQKMRYMPKKHLETDILEGNIGLLTVNDVLGSEEGIDKAMAKLSSTDGLIIDARSCPGGNEKTITQLVSYFMPQGKAILEMHPRGKPMQITKSVQLPVSAKRYLNKPLFVLSSNNTGSACEELSFDIKHHDLGYVIGKNTSGAGFALQNEPEDVGYGLVALIPKAVPRHPGTKLTFEKVGVAPDIEMNPILALDEAHQMILSQLISEKGKTNKLSTALFSSIQKSTKEAIKLADRSKQFRTYLGLYGNEDKIIFADGNLSILTGARKPLGLTQIENDLFSINKTRGGQIRFERDNKGKITGFSEYRARNSSWTFNKKKL